MQIKGIKQGQIIQLLEPLPSISDGQEVTISIQLITKPSPPTKPTLTDQERLERLNKLFGVWQEQPDLIEIFAEIARERHADYGREIASFDE